MEILYTSSAKLPAHITPEPPVTGTALINVGQGERLLSVAGGALLSTLALKKKFSVLNLIAGALGGVFLFRGISGYCPLNALSGRNTAHANNGNVLDVSMSLRIERPVNVVYNAWKKFENLPEFMHHLQSVEQFDPEHSHWIADFPGSLGRISWEAEVITDDPERELAWRSLPGSMIDNAGVIYFEDAGQTSIMDIHIAYRPPVGYIGKAVANLLNPALKEMIEDDMKRYARALEEHKQTEPFG